MSVINGAVLDVIVCVKPSSPHFGKSFSVILSSENNLTIYIPPGYAHGFKSLDHNTIAVYLQSQLYSAKHDAGVAWDSFGFDWELEGDPIISDKDLTLPPLLK